MSSADSKSKNDRSFFEHYVSAIEPIDRSLVEDFGSDLDGLLIFSGLFSAVSTAFIMESYKLMQPDFVQLTYYAALNATPPYTPNTFVIPPSARRVNGLWISSLVLSILVALLVLLTKQWLLSYTVPPGEDIRQQVLLRQFHFNCLFRWRVPEIVAALPIIMTTSLFLFLTGLVIFLFDIDESIAWVVLGFACALATIYAVCTLSPLIWPHSPLRSVLTPCLQGFLLSTVRTLHLPDWASPVRWTEDPWHGLPEIMVPECLASAVSYYCGLTYSKSPGWHMSVIRVLDEEILHGLTAPALSAGAQEDIRAFVSTVLNDTHTQQEIAHHLPVCVRAARTWLSTQDLFDFLSMPEFFTALQRLRDLSDPSVSSLELLSGAVEELALSLRQLHDADVDSVPVKNLMHEFLAASVEDSPGPSKIPSEDTSLATLMISVLRDTELDIRYITRIVIAVLSLRNVDPTNDCWPIIARAINKCLTDDRFRELEEKGGVESLWIILGQFYTAIGLGV